MRSTLFLAVFLHLALHALAANPEDAKWLAENAKKPGVMITASGLQYTVIETGKDKGRTPGWRDECTCNYVGKLVDGKEFDSSSKKKDKALSKLSPSQVVRGWAEALQMMREGDTWEILLPPELAYGDHGGMRGGLVKPGAAVSIRVELLTVRRANFNWKLEHFIAIAIGVMAAIAGVRKLMQRKAIPLGKCVGAAGNSFVFFEVAIDGVPAGRIEMELFNWVAPKTVENFRCLCTGEKGMSLNWPDRPLHFKGTRFHRIVPGFMMQGGDIVGKGGMGAESIYGGPFDDEWTHGMVKHSERGMLSMANSGADLNGSQFFITSWRCSWVDGEHVVFGRVLKAMASRTLDKIEDCGNSDDKIPVVKEVIITDCGEFTPSDKKED
mmetsp:Transcript_64007/g.153173  ORF Transcript_64007/g.153173 Transcript_64007/m.153173 type:complete len:382 (-) Transcript_64007:44-1189(-)